MIDPADVRDWFEAHAAPLVLYARQWLTGVIAEDVVQEVFVRLMSQRHPPDNVKAWLYRSVRNEAISQWRSTHRRRDRELAAASGARWFEPAHDDAIDAGLAAELIRQLPAEQRESLVLRIWGGLTLAEISMITGSPLSTVFHHYQQGLRAVRKQMGVTCEKKND
jgi:RNA polymerase sigma-70 factor (ECF subfamily)